MNHQEIETVPIPKLLSLVLLAAVPQVAAQVPSHLAVGDMVFDANLAEVRVIPEVGFASTPYTGSVGHHVMLWDPQHPDSFYVGAGGLGMTGSVQRMDFVGGGSIEYTLIADPGFTTPNDLAFDQSGDLEDRAGLLRREIWYEFIRLHHKLLPLFTDFIRSKKYRLQVLRLLQGEVFDRVEVPVLQAMREFIASAEETHGHAFANRLTDVPLDDE